MKGQNILLILFFSCFFFIQCNTSNNDYLKKGKQTKAKIGFKQNPNNSSEYVLLVYFFTKDTLISHNPSEHPIWKNDTLPLEEKVKQWNLLTKEMGDVFSAEINVDFDIYSKYKEGDIVDIYYLPKNPHKAILKDLLIEK